MLSINKIQAKHIEALSPEQLTQLLLMLVHLEVAIYELNGFHYISQKINVADGGEDGKVEIDDPKISNWLKNKVTLFQCKATNLTKSKCKDEILQDRADKKGKELKPAIKAALDKKGDYILFMAHSIGKSSGINDRLNGFKDAFKSLKKRFPSKQFRVYDAQKISEWTNEYISAATYVMECNGITRDLGFQTWAQWNQTVNESDNNISYQRIPQIAIIEQQLKNLLKSNKSVRVIGHSGIGKTRFVLESLAPIKNDEEQNILNSSLVYYDLGLVSGDEVVKFILSHKYSTQCLLVLDNCSQEKHDALKGLLDSRSKIKILTIDFAVNTSEQAHILITKDMQQEAVKGMLTNIYPAATTLEIDKLTKLTEGYPRMVGLINSSISQTGLDPINPKLPEDFVERLVFGRSKVNKTELSIIKACAIFSEFNFIDEESSKSFSTEEIKRYETQYQFIASEICIPRVTKQEFYKACRNFKADRAIMERRGIFYTVVPTPLAGHLAADWLLDYPPGDMDSLSKKMVDAGLMQAFCDRLTALDQIERAQSLVAKLWGPGGPFATAEVLNSNLGSRLFRSVVEVNPESTVEALANAFITKSIAELKNTFGEGRRNIIWALEKLVFRNETFSEAVKLLLHFAAAENENIANNATGQFLQLFHTYLPGTEVDFNERLKIIDFSLASELAEYNILGIQALSHAVKLNNFTRTSGPEQQGSQKPLKDYTPQTFDDIRTYLNGVLDRLIYKALKIDIKLTKTVLESSIRTMFFYGLHKEVSEAIRTVIKTDSSLWEEAIRELKLTIQFDYTNEASKNIAEELIGILTPSDLSSQFYFKVSRPEFDYNAEHGINKSEEELINFTNELVKNKVDLSPYLNQLLIGDQQFGYIFGAHLGTIVAEKDKINLGLEMIKALKSVEKTKRNPVVLGGYLQSLTITDKRSILENLISDEDLINSAFPLTRMSSPSYSDIIILFDLINAKDLSVNLFLEFLYGGALEKLIPDELMQFGERLKAYGIDGAWLALILLDQTSHFNETKWAKLKEYFRLLLIENNFLLYNPAPRLRNENYRWSHNVIKLLKDSQDSEFASVISKQIYSQIEIPKFHINDVHLKSVCSVLVADYFDAFWSEINKGFLIIGPTFLNLKYLLGSKNGNYGNSGVLFTGSEYFKIIAWCKENLPKAPLKIGNIMPITEKANSQNEKWHPFALKMINEFASVKGFLSEVSANMNSFGWVGSLIPYFLLQQQLFNDLVTSTNPEIVKWAKDGIKSLDLRIQRERIEIESNL